MSTIVTRASKGSALSYAEADANFNNLNTDKLEASDIGVTVQAYSANLDEYAAVNPTAAGLALLDDADASAQRGTLGLVIGTDVQSYAASASQGEMEAGTEAALRSMSPLRVAQAIAALTPSSSGAPTGSVFDYVGSTEPSGYVFLSGRTIGNGSSGGTARANADTSALFTLLWDSMADAEAPVSSGRGANAAADFAANKTITLPDARGRIIAGKDNMGGTTASRLTNGGSGITGTTLGVSGGTETHTLTTAELASHAHTGVGTLKESNAGGSAQGLVQGNYGNTCTTTGGDTSFSAYISTATAGSGNAHQNTQPTLVLNKIIKL